MYFMRILFIRNKFSCETQTKLPSSTTRAHNSFALASANVLELCPPYPYPYSIDIIYSYMFHIQCYLYIYTYIFNFQLLRDVTPLTTALSPRDIQIIKCNGNITKIQKDNVCTYHPEYISQIVILGKCFSVFIFALLFPVFFSAHVFFFGVMMFEK